MKARKFTEAQIAGDFGRHVLQEQPDGFAKKWHNALEGAAAFHNDTFLALDELGLVDGRRRL